MKKILSLIIVFMFMASPIAMSVENSNFYMKGVVQETKSKYKKIPVPKVTINVEELDLKSKLKEEYSAYKYTIKNKSDKALYIVNGSFENGTNGGDAYFLVRKNADTEVEKTVWKHSKWGLWTLGIAWTYDFIKAPIVWFVHTRRNKKMKLESLKYCKNVFYPSDFDPNDTIEKNILFPIDKKPYVRMTFRENDTGYLFTISKEND